MSHVEPSVLPAPATATAASRAPGIGLLVTAYDAEQSIASTLQRIPESVWQAIHSVIVIDDASTDETVEKALEFDSPWKSKIVVLRNRVTQHYGGTLKIGFQHAIDRGLDAVVLLHAAGEFAPESLPLLLEPLTRGGADMVIGTRMADRAAVRKCGMPWYKVHGNRVLTAVQRALTGIRLSEFHSGYRAYRVDFLKHILFWENTDGWHFDTQILLQAARSGARIVEVPIPPYFGKELTFCAGLKYAVSSTISCMVYFLCLRHVVYSRNLDVTIRGRRYFEKFSDPASSHSLIWKELQKEGVSGQHVLELGVGDASLTRRMHEAGAVIDGIEIDALSAELARPFCRNVYVSDLDSMDGLPMADQYDVVLAADVLEHLRDPEFVLSRLKKCVKKGGLLVVSLPNIVNLYVRLNILFGRYPTHSKGLLDRTHLHCYTLKTAEQMVHRCGWLVVGRDVTAIPLPIVFPFLARGPLRLLLRLFHAATRLFRGLLGYQCLLFCRNPNSPRLL